MDYRTFTVATTPHGKGRPRAFNSPSGIRFHTDAKTTASEASIRSAYLAKFSPPEPLQGPVAVSIKASFAPPCRASRKAHDAMLRGETLPAKRPDADNIAKGVLDALNGIAWRDDAQVTRLTVVKIYAEAASLEITIEPAVLALQSDARPSQDALLSARCSIIAASNSHDAADRLAMAKMGRKYLDRFIIELEAA